MAVFRQAGWLAVTVCVEYSYYTGVGKERNVPWTDTARKTPARSVKMTCYVGSSHARRLKHAHVTYILRVKQTPLRGRLAGSGGILQTGLHLLARRAQMESSVLRMEAGAPLVPLAKRRGHTGERLVLPTNSAPPTTLTSPLYSTPLGTGGSPTAPGPDGLSDRDIGASNAQVARQQLVFGHQTSPISAPPAGMRGAGSSFPELHPSADARFFDDLAEALHRLRPCEGMPSRRLALHKVARLLGEIPDGADSSRLGAVMAAGDALALLCAILRDSFIADCDTSDIWLLHCALALCVNLACHDPDAIVREAGLGPFVLSGLSSANERTRMLCAAGAHNIASSLEGAQLVLHTHTRKKLEELTRADNMGIAHHARCALLDAERQQGGGRVALLMARTSLCVLGVAVLLVALIFFLAIAQRTGDTWGLLPIRYARSSAANSPPRVCE